MSYGITDQVFNKNQFFEGNQDIRPRLDELRSIQEKRVRGDDVVVGDSSAREIVEFIVKRAGYLGHRLIGPLIDVWAEALMQHVEDVCEGNPLAYVNPHWDHAARVRDPQFRDAVNYSNKTPTAEDPKDNGSLHPNGYRKPVTSEDARKIVEELKRVAVEAASGNVGTGDEDIREILEK